MIRLLFIISVMLFSCRDKSSKVTISKHDQHLDEKITSKGGSGIDPNELITIATGNNDTLTYSKQAFNIILDSFPTLHDTIPLHPDIAYHNSNFFRSYVDNNGIEQHISFGSEVGQDEFYVLYAYFLHKRQTSPELTPRRKNLWAIYQQINSIFGSLSYGGTYFGHQAARISAYVEYDIYMFNYNEDFYQKSYSITAQKNLYLAGLRQRVSDEIEHDAELIDKASRLKRKNELFKTVNELDRLITDFFYLSQAQKYQYSFYL